MGNQRLVLALSLAAPVLLFIALFQLLITIPNISYAAPLARGDDRADRAAIRQLSSGVVSPTLIVSTDSIESPQLVGTLVTHTITITNAGSEVVILDVLETNLAGTKILYDSYHGYPPENEYEIMLSDLITLGAQITETSGMITGDVLDGYDALWFNCCGGIFWSSNELAAVDQWITSGGSVLVHGEPQSQAEVLASLFGVAYVPYVQINAEICFGFENTFSNIVPHPVTRGVGTIRLMELYCHYLDPGTAGSTVVFDLDDNPHVVVVEQGMGRGAIVESYELNDHQITMPDSDNRRLGTNLFTWLVDPVPNEIAWLSTDALTLTVPAGESASLEIYLDASHGDLGENRAILAFDANDPSPSATVLLPITMDVLPEERFLPVVSKRFIAEQIAFVTGSISPSQTNIYLMQADGTKQVNLTNSTGNYGDLAWSPDGRWLAYAHLADIHIMRPDGAEKTNLTNAVGHDQSPQWSPEGTQIAFSSFRDGNWEVYVMDSDGSSQTRLTFSGGTGPSWSPDSMSLALEQMGEIFTMNPDGTAAMNLTNHPATDSGPSWSPAGGQIAFLSDRDSSPGPRDMFVMNNDGSNPINLTPGPGAYADTFSWSPDGGKLAFIQGCNVYVVNPDGSGLIPITVGFTGCSVPPVPFPTWSSNGQQLAFMADSDIYVVNTDGSAWHGISGGAIYDVAWRPR